MARDLVSVYFKLVVSGKLDIEDVPEKYREKVREMLQELEDDGNGPE